LFASTRGNFEEVSVSTADGRFLVTGGAFAATDFAASFFAATFAFGFELPGACATVDSASSEEDSSLLDPSGLHAGFFDVAFAFLAAVFFPSK
jgi:hypothetical protein